MKRIIVLLTILTVFYGQNGNKQNPMPDYLQLQKHWESLAKIYSEDTGEGGMINEYERWKAFGSYRFYNLNGQLQIGSICDANNSNSNWELLGPKRNVLPLGTMGIVVSLAVNPKDSSVIYAGSRTGGLWRARIDTSNFQNMHWKCLTDNPKLPIFGVNSIAIDPVDTNNIYIGTGYDTYFYPFGYSAGVFKSSDGGNTWQQCDLNPFDIVHDGGIIEVRINPKNPNTIYALSKKHLYRSYDKGNTWDTIFDIYKTNLWDVNSKGEKITLGGFSDMEIMLSDTNVIYLGTYLEGIYFTGYPLSCTDYDFRRNGADIYYTNDNGNTWHSVYGDKGLFTRSLWISLDVTPADSDKIYMAKQSITHHGGCLGYATIDSTIINAYGKYGNVLRQRQNNLPLSVQIRNISPAFEVSPTDTNVMYFEGGNIGDRPAKRRRLVRYIYPNATIDTCFFPYSLTAYVHADQREILVLRGSAPGTNGADDWILLGNDGGVAGSFNGGNSWHSLNGTGLTITQFYGIDVTKNSPHILAGGTQDNAEFVYDNGDWIIPEGFLVGDCGDVIFNPKNDNVFWTQSWGGPGSPGIHKVKKINSWDRDSTTTPDQNGLLVFPMEVIGDSLYIATDTIWRSPLSSGLSFSFYSSVDTFGDAIRSMDICDSDPDIMYVAFDKVPWKLDSISCSKILYRSLDGGQNWTDITHNLRAIHVSVPCEHPIGDIEINPDRPNEVWVAVGFYGKDYALSPPYNGFLRVLHSTDYGNTWEDYTTGLTPFPVNKLVYDPDDNILYAATDVGVFYTIPDRYDSIGWQCFNMNLPVTIVTDLVTDYQANRLVASTFGRGIWVSPRYCPGKLYSITHAKGDTVYGDLYFADNITSSGVIASISNVTYKATQEITLGDGFEANGNDGVVFHAYISDCEPLPPPASSNRVAGSSKSKKPAKVEEKEVVMPKVYPNPTESSLRVEVPSGNYYYEIYDLQGHKVKFGKLEGDLSVVDLPGGVYVLKVFNSSEVYLYKIVKL